MNFQVIFNMQYRILIKSTSYWNYKHYKERDPSNNIYGFENLFQILKHYIEDGIIF